MYYLQEVEAGQKYCASHIRRIVWISLFACCCAICFIYLCLFCADTPGLLFPPFSLAVLLAQEQIAASWKRNVRAAFCRFVAYGLAIFVGFLFFVFQKWLFAAVWKARQIQFTNERIKENRTPFFCSTGSAENKRVLIDDKLSFLGQVWCSKKVQHRNKRE